MTLDIALIARALPGLRTVSDDAEALVAALEDAVAQAQRVTTRVKVRCDARTVADAVRRHGNPSAAARALGVPRSTLRDAIRREGV